MAIGRRRTSALSTAVAPPSRGVMGYALLLFIVAGIGMFVTSMVSTLAQQQKQQPQPLRQSTEVIMSPWMLSPELSALPPIGYSTASAPRGWFGGGGGMDNPLSMFVSPIAPPLRDERVMVPINVSTNVGATPYASYRQVGLLTPLNGKSTDRILPLMAKPLFTNRDKWQYYTISNQQNQVKLPVSRNGRSCTNEYGCDKLENGDTVYVEGSNEVYRVTLYDNGTNEYLPMVL